MTQKSGDGEKSQKNTDAANKRFWTRVAVRIDEKQKDEKQKDNKLGNLKVYKISISPERRETAVEIRTKKEDPKHVSVGDHLVAWSAMCQYWNTRLTNKPLSEVLETLKEWLISDQSVDEKTGYKKNDISYEIYQANTEKRARAWYLIKELETKTNELSINEINDYLEEAISDQVHICV